MIVCNEKEGALWMQIAFHCKAMFGTVRMPTRIP